MHGTHYTCYYKSHIQHNNLYFDSFSFPAPQELSNKLGRYIYNHNVIQSLNSSSCGWYCIMIVRECEKLDNSPEAFEEVLSRFTNKPDTNERILENYFSNLSL